MSSDIQVRYHITAQLDERGIRAALEYLSSDEKERHGRFRFAKDRRDFAAAHALLRGTLSEHGNLAPRDWTFVSGLHGKPQLTPGTDNDNNLSFNLSHTDGLVACAVVRGAEVGVDVERLDRAADVLDLAHRYFSPIERAQLKQCPAPQRAIRFIEVWTLKEAYIKATGYGLLCPLDAFAFVFDGPISFRLETFTGIPADSWQFSLTHPTPDHCLAVAVRNAPQQSRITISERR